MRLTKFVLVFSILCNIMAIDAMAQQNRFKNERRIYLWDVTLSMKGQGSQPTPDIYSKVVEALEKDINSIKDEQTEIWVLPFQTSILDRWNAVATSTGKNDLIQQIRRFEISKLTKTDIALPMKEVMNTWIKADKRNVLILLTDGIQNNTSKSVLIEQIKKWCLFAEKNDAYAFYVMLTQFAQDKELINAIDETCRMSKVISNDDIDLNFVELMPQSNYKYNIKDDCGKTLTFRIDCKKRVTIPDELKIKCYSEPNPYIEVMDTAVITNGLLEVGIKQKQSYDSLKTALPQDSNEEIMIHFEVDNPGVYPLVQLLNKECCLELINKPEKILKVYVKD